MSRMCKLYNLLFRVLPVNAWRVRLMDKHLSLCPHCGEKTGNTEGTADKGKIKEFLVSLENASALPPLWPGLMEKIPEGEKDIPVPKPKSRRLVTLKWQWAAAAALLVIVLLIPLAFGPGAGPEAGREQMIEEVVVESVKAFNHPAGMIYFNSRDPDRLIVWVKK